MLAPSYHHHHHHYSLPRLVSLYGVREWSYGVCWLEYEDALVSVCIFYSTRRSSDEEYMHSTAEYKLKSSTQNISL